MEAEFPMTRAEAPQPDRNPFLRPIAEIYADLAKPVPARLIAQKKVPTKKGKSYTADYVHHAVIRDLLDHYAPGWAWTERPYLADGKLYLTGALTIHGTAPDGSLVEVTREATGNDDSDLDGYGDPSSNASAQALRRAAMSHGLCRKLWKRR